MEDDFNTVSEFKAFIESRNVVACTCLGISKYSVVCLNFQLCYMWKRIRLLYHR